MTNPEPNVATWTLQQATLLEQGRFEDVDLLTIIEKMDGMSNAKKRALVKLLEVLLMHLLTDR